MPKLSSLKTLRITIDFPDNLHLTESDLRREMAIAMRLFIAEGIRAVAIELFSPITSMGKFK